MTAPDPVAFTIFGIDIYWYGVLIVLAFITAILLGFKRAPKHNISADTLLDILIFAIPSSIIGARLYYVAFEWSNYSNNLSEIFHTRGGGLAIHGGLIGAFLAGFFVCKYKKVSFLNAMDLCIPFIALAQAIGRWGNFFNSEAHGGPTDLPWGVMVNGVKVHPTFLYESLWCFALFIILILIDNRRTFYGQTACIYGILYSLERIFVEQLRTDSLMIGAFKQAQLISVAFIVICLVLFFYFKNNYRLSKEERIKR